MAEKDQNASSTEEPRPYVYSSAGTRDPVQVHPGKSGRVGGRTRERRPYDYGRDMLHGPEVWSREEGYVWRRRITTGK